MFNENLCRTCLTVKTELVSITALVEDETRVIDCFNNSMKISIKEGDILPQMICLNCLDNVLEVRKFYNKCLESENYLKQQIFEEIENIESNEDFVTNEERIKTGITIDICDDKLQNENKINEYQCSICKEHFKYEKNLKLHLNLEHDVEVINKDDDKCIKENATYFKCNICYYSFKFEKNFNKHMNRHRKLRKIQISNPTRCREPGCKKSFYGKSAMELHFAQEHSENFESLLCQICGITLTNKKTYYQHINRHSKMKMNVKKFQCSHCDKKFQSNHHRISHERIHTKERPFICKFCGKSFSQSSVLYTHMQLHTGKKIECPLCDKKFSRKGFLAVHMRAHTQERPYECEICSQSYTQKCHLKAHFLSAHSQEKPYKCKICNKKFAKSELLSSHRYQHTTKPYKCPSCSLETASSFWFKKHLKRAHNIEDDIKKYKRKVEYLPEYNENNLIYVLDNDENNDNSKEFITITSENIDNIIVTC